mgnify:CR=1 FL=1
MSNATFTGAVTLVNVWASWCVPCLVEHPLLVQLSRDGTLYYQPLPGEDPAQVSAVAPVGTASAISQLTI